jgi:hypothetical protein
MRATTSRAIVEAAFGSNTFGSKVRAEATWQGPPRLTYPRHHHHEKQVLKLLDFPFPSFDAKASIRVLSAPYLFWPSQADDGSQIKVYVRLSALEDVLGIVEDLPGRDLSVALRESLLKHRRRIEEAANRLYEAGAVKKIFLEAADF